MNNDFYKYGRARIMCKKCQIPYKPREISRDRDGKIRFAIYFCKECGQEIMFEGETDIINSFWN